MRSPVVDAWVTPITPALPPTLTTAWNLLLPRTTTAATTGPSEPGRIRYILRWTLTALNLDPETTIPTATIPAWQTMLTTRTVPSTAAVAADLADTPLLDTVFAIADALAYSGNPGPTTTAYETDLPAAADALATATIGYATLHPDPPAWWTQANPTDCLLTLLDGPDR